MVQKTIEVPQKPAKVSNEEAKSKSVHKLGIIASILVLVGFILPALAYFWFYLVVWPNKKPQLVLFLFLFGAIELAGFMIGFISWKDRFGKAAAITSGALLMLSALLLIKFVA